jgi:hypothetical protein
MKTLHKRCAGLDVHKVEVVLAFGSSIWETKATSCAGFQQPREG